MRRQSMVLVLLAVLFIGVGIAIPKLTVQDAVQLTDEERNCVQTNVWQQLDHPLQRIALWLGKSAVIYKQGDGVIKEKTLVVKSYTIFRIPLPSTRLFNRFTEQVICDWAGSSEDNPSTDNVYTNKSLGISFNYSIDYVLSEGKGESG